MKKNNTSVSLELTEIKKSFAGQNQRLDVLKGISLEINGGQAVAITGPSGSGKSTVLHIIGTLDYPTSGKLVINGREPFAMPERELAKFRNEIVGFVFQEHHLLPQYSVLENVLIPTMAFPENGNDAQTSALRLLDRVGLKERLEHRPHELSGGERQRVAIARALINNPSLLLCDEPTGNLDQATADSVASLLFELHHEEKNILIVVTHSLELAKRFDTRLRLENGRLVTNDSHPSAS